jgi:hypothetical protein
VTTNFYSLTTYGDKVDSVATRDKMEKLLHTNWANRAAFELLHSDITLERLLQLQKRYFELRTKVAQQPSDQRAYEADVSLNSPFISR